MLSILKIARMPLLLHQEEQSHFHSLAAHLVLLTIRQYEGKSYRMFTEWLVEAYYCQDVPQSIQIYLISQHYRNLQIESQLYHSGKYNFFFHSPYNYQTDILWNETHLDSSQAMHHSITHERSRLRKKWIIKLSVGDDDMLKQIILHHQDKESS